MVPTLRRPRLPFRRALRRAIYRGWKNGNITPEQAYLLYDILNGSNNGGRYRRKPELLLEAERVCRQELVVHDSESAETGDIDWAHWIDLIVTWLPLVIKVLLVVLKFEKAPANEPSESSKITIPPVDTGA